MRVGAPPLVCQRGMQLLGSLPAHTVLNSLTPEQSNNECDNNHKKDDHCCHGQQAATLGHVKLRQEGRQRSQAGRQSSRGSRVHVACRVGFAAELIG